MYFSWTAHRRLLGLALPLILSNITTPLLGLVDSAVLGHLNEHHYLAGASLGALILTQVYWICGFMRMSMTGLSAQIFGSEEKGVVWPTLLPSIVLALLLATAVLVLQSPLLGLSLSLAGSEASVSDSASAYFAIRVWGAPFALINLVLLGWMIGQQQSRWVLWLQLLANCINGALDIWFVHGLQWGVEGVAAASVAAEVVITVGACGNILMRHGLPERIRAHFKFGSVSRLLSLNRDMALRNLFLQACLAFVTYQGARLGDLTLATNALLMNFFVLIALGLDGIAQGTEALVGEAKGKGTATAVRGWVGLGTLWSGLCAVLYALMFWAGGELIVAQLTDISALREHACAFLWLMIVLPLIAHWCFLLDGVFVGLTRAKAMRDTMLLSAILGFLPIWWLTQDLKNTGLWLSLLGFFAARGLSLGICYVRIARAERLLD